MNKLIVIIDKDFNIDKRVQIFHNAVDMLEWFEKRKLNIINYGEDSVSFRFKTENGIKFDAEQYWGVMNG